MKIVIGSRGSNLALTQSRWVINEIKQHSPHIDFDIKVIETKGDKNQDMALDKIKGRGIFVGEIEEALLTGEIDMAIHSMKDMPADMPPGLIFTTPPRREDSRDVMVFREEIKFIDHLPPGSLVGTSSKGRQYQLLGYRPDLKADSIRGNVETRIRKLEEGQYDAIILAAAGLKRIDLEEKIGCYLSMDIMLPFPTQGILAIQIREDHPELKNILQAIGDERANIQAKAERTFLKLADRRCHEPVGAYCEIKGQDIILKGMLGTADGSRLVRKTIKGKMGQEEALAEKLAEEIREELTYGRR